MYLPVYKYEQVTPPPPPPLPIPLPIIIIKQEEQCDDPCGEHTNDPDACCENKQCEWKNYQECAEMSENECCEASERCAWYTPEDLLCANIASQSACCATNGCSFYGYDLSSAQDTASTPTTATTTTPASTTPPNTFFLDVASPRNRLKTLKLLQIKDKAGGKHGKSGKKATSKSVLPIEKSEESEESEQSSAEQCTESKHYCATYCPADDAALQQMGGDSTKPKGLMPCGSGKRNQPVEVTVRSTHKKYCVPDTIVRENEDIPPSLECEAKGALACGSGLKKKPRFFVQSGEEYCCPNALGTQTTFLLDISSPTYYFKKKASLNLFLQIGEKNKVGVKKRGKSGKCGKSGGSSITSATTKAAANGGCDAACSKADTCGTSSHTPSASEASRFTPSPSLDKEDEEDNVIPQSSTPPKIEPPGVCWPTAAPIPAGAHSLDTCCQDSTCENIVRECDCYLPCDLDFDDTIEFAHDCPGGADCDVKKQQQIDCAHNIPGLEQLAIVLKKYDGTGNTNRIIIELHGHTDATGGDAYNLALSTKRAAYAHWLLSTKIGEPGNMVDMSQIVGAKGYGERCMKVSTSEKDPNNRRVDFWRADPTECLNDAGISIDDQESLSENCAKKCQRDQEEENTDAKECEPEVADLQNTKDLGTLWEGACKSEENSAAAQNKEEEEEEEDETGFLDMAAANNYKDAKDASLIEETAPEATPEETPETGSEGSGASDDIGSAADQPGSLIGTRCGGKCYGQWEPMSCNDVCNQVRKNPSSASTVAVQVSRLEECSEDDTDHTDGASGGDNASPAAAPASSAAAP